MSSKSPSDLLAALQRSFTPLVTASTWRSPPTRFASLPLLDLRSLLLTTVLLGTTQLTLAAIVRRRGTFPLAKTIFKIHANIYAWVSFSLVLTSAIPEKHWPTFILRALEKLGLPADAELLYHYSKFYEHIDVILVTLMGREMDWHWGFHHPTTPYWTYARCILHPDGGSWRLFAALNALHHWIMYGRFAGHDFGSSYMGYTGTTQLSVGALMEMLRGIVEYRSNFDAGFWKFHAFAGGLLFSYLSFFMRMVFARDSAPADSQKKEAAAAERK